MISRSKSNNVAPGSTSEDGIYGLSHKMRSVVHGSKLDILTQFRSYIG
jgi:hypothetical protein